MICEEKTCDFRTNGGFEKTRGLGVNGGIFLEKTRDLFEKWYFLEEKA